MTPQARSGRWRTAGALATVLAVGAVTGASLWGIVGSLGEARETAERAFALETIAWARAIEGRLSGARGALEFLARSPAFALPDGAAAGADSPLGGALLLFLRDHPEVARLVVTDAGAPVLEAGRPRGVPGIWHPGPVAGEDGVNTSVTLTGLTPGTSGRLAAVLDPAALARDLGATCRLEDATGALLAGDERQRAGQGAVSVAIAVPQWSSAGPWQLRCVRPGGLAPFAESPSAPILAQLGVMVLAWMLGGFGLRQLRRRQLLEEVAREQARVRELERRLFHAERLSTVGRLAAGIAHEVNNPLEGMANYLHLAREALAAGDAAAAGTWLDGADQGLRRAAEIIRRVLDQASAGNAARAVFDAREVLAQSVEFVRSRPEFGRIRFVVDLDRGPLPVDGSAVALGQVFLNLLLNACEAQPEGGEVSVRGAPEGPLVRVTIGDRGPGVPAADRERVFEPFYSTKASSGLGLAVCQEILRQHRGEIALADRSDGGAVFEVRLPRHAG